MRDRKLHKLLGVEDEAKWLAKILDSRYEIENGPSSYIFCIVNIMAADVLAT